jgi:hypothetical protein
MKLRYVWREIGDDGQLLDPDVNRDRPPLNSYEGYHLSRQSAIQHYRKTYEDDHYGVTPRELVLLEVYRAV